MYEFFLYPFVHLSLNKGVFIYNTLNNQYIEDKNFEVFEFIKKLQESDSSCIKVDNSVLRKDSINGFIKRVRESFAGDLLESSEQKEMPVQLIEDLKIHRNNKDVQEADVGVEILEYLNKCLIYINSTCDLDCSGCMQMYKQFPFCKKSEVQTEINIDRLKDLLMTLNRVGVPEILISGGDVLLYPFFEDLLLFVKQLNVKITFLINKKQLQFHDSEKIGRLLEGVNVKILVNDLDNFKSFQKNMESVLRKSVLEYMFVIQSEVDYERFEVLAEGLQEISADVRAFYNNDNLSFFEDVVYITEEDLFAETQSLNSIHTNQVMNKQFFGSMIIDNNLNVYSSINKSSIGRISENSFQELVYKEINNVFSWRLTRAHFPVCRDCNYCFLCPSPGDYELVLNKPNLCHVVN